jgi:hypothetical protein
MHRSFTIEGKALVLGGAARVLDSVTATGDRGSIEV